MKVKTFTSPFPLRLKIDTLLAVEKRYDGILAILIWSLVIFGIIAISSASVHESRTLMERIYDTEYCMENNCNGFYLWRHVKHVVLGVGVFLIGLFTPVSFWRRVAMPIFFLTLGLLMLLLASSIGGDWGTAKSWINISFLPSIQPSELAKLAMIFYLGIWMDKKEDAIGTWENGFFPFVVLMIPIVVLLALQPDFGSLLVIMAIATTMFFLAGGNFFHLLLGGVMAGILIFLPVFFANCEEDNRSNFCYISERIDAFLGGSDETTNYQVKQSLIAVGSGELFGVGYNNSGQRNGFLPEAQSDTIFAIISEEFGFLRVLFLILAFTGIAFFGLETAKAARNRFEMLVAGGITAWFSFQALINMAVVTKLFPVTGITLPFISYGGSSLLALLFAGGVLVRIAQLSSPHNADVFSRGRVRRAYFPRTRRRV